ncbi:MAG: hypothetical protein JRI86_14850 [Deltaproteobacteria bacterium]|nr:hypothetical protein [Deltaproteobacteria bacterium]
MVTNSISSISEITASQLDIKADKNTEQKDTRAVEETGNGEGSKPEQNSDDLFMEQSIKDPADSENSIYLTYNSKGQFSRAVPQYADSTLLAYDLNSSTDQTTSTDTTGDNQQGSIDLIV